MQTEAGNADTENLTESLNVAVDNYKVGRDLEIHIEVRPRSQSGVLIAVHGRMDFLVLQIVEGTVSGRGWVQNVARTRFSVLLLLHSSGTLSIKF